MVREEIKKYVKYSSFLRKKIKETESEKVKKILIEELTNVYNKLEFLRNLNNAFCKQGDYYEKRR